MLSIGELQVSLSRFVLIPQPYILLAPNWFNYKYAIQDVFNVSNPYSWQLDIIYKQNNLLKVDDIFFMA
jgi:hypothetical protein